MLVVAAAILASVALIFFATGDAMATLAYAGGLFVLALLAFVAARGRPRPVDQPTSAPDWSVTVAAIELEGVAVAITDRANRLVCANAAFADWFGTSSAPPRLPVDGKSAEHLARCARAAWRDGESESTAIADQQQSWTACAQRAGRADEYLVWRFTSIRRNDPLTEIARDITGPLAWQLSRGGVEVALVGADGAIRAASSGLARRAAGDESASMVGQDFVGLFRSDNRGRIYFSREGGKGSPQMMVDIPFSDSDEADVGSSNAPSLVLLIDSGTGVSSWGGEVRGQDSPLEALLEQMPLGLALTDRDGHFLFANPAFRQVAGIGIDERLPPHAADLVVSHDKTAVSDAVRRCGQAAGVSGRLAVRVKKQPEVPALLSLVGVRGLGKPAVLLNLSTPEGIGGREPKQADHVQAIPHVASRPENFDGIAEENRQAEGAAVDGHPVAKGRILLIEPDEMVRAVAERALVKQGYSVAIAADGDEGLELLRDGRFDLALSALHMPGVDGVALARELRQLRPKLPVLLMSDYADQQLSRNEGLSGVDLIAKPFSVQQIARKVDAILREI